MPRQHFHPGLALHAAVMANAVKTAAGGR